jgi:hypothetical protein
VVGVGGGGGIGVGATSFAGPTNTFLSPTISDNAMMLLPALMLPMMANDIINSTVAEIKQLTK